MWDWPSQTHSYEMLLILPFACQLQNVECFCAEECSKTSLWHKFFVFSWSGSHIRWGQAFRLRHLSTGNYLALTEDRGLVLQDREKSDTKSTAFCFRASKVSAHYPYVIYIYLFVQLWCALWTQLKGTLGGGVNKCTHLIKRNSKLLTLTFSQLLSRQHCKCLSRQSCFQLAWLLV